MKILFVLGTRPEIIKMWSCIKYCQKNNINFEIIHTGQHYSENMSDNFFKELDLPEPYFNLDVNGLDNISKLTDMIEKLKHRIKVMDPDFVFVQGDTISVLAGAIVGKFLKIPVVHIEAGLRCWEWIPEEISRAMIDSIADYKFVPTASQQENILDWTNMYVVGNTISDIVQHYGKEDIKYYKKLGLKSKEYFLLTCHREENLTKEKLKELMEICLEIHSKYKVPIVFPIHPNTANKIREFKINFSSGLKVIEPTSYKEMISLIKNAKATLSDSGGLAEENCILKTSCIILRNSTERPEVLEVGGAICTGMNKRLVIENLEELLRRKINWYNPFGENVAEKIFNELRGERNE